MDKLNQQNAIYQNQVFEINFNNPWYCGLSRTMNEWLNTRSASDNFGIYDMIDRHIDDYMDKDQKIRDLEARVKELEAILEEEI